jgi:hypothetical protein
MCTHTYRPLDRINGGYLQLDPSYPLILHIFIQPFTLRVIYDMSSRIHVFVASIYLGKRMM